MIRLRNLFSAPLLCGLVLVSAAAPLAAVETPARPEYAHAFHRGEYSRAIALATEHLEREPNDVAAWVVRARAEAALGRFDAAYAGFREALRLAPEDATTLYYLGVTAGALAQLQYDRLLAEAPSSARAHQVLGQSYEAQGKTPEAEAEYQAALEKNPALVEALVALGDLARGDLARSAERLAEARDYYARALGKAPRNYDALYGLGACEALSGEHRRAIDLFRRALKEAPDSAPARLALGISLLQTGETTTAVVELEAAARLEPGMRQAYFHLARAYHSLGRTEDSERAVARFQELAREEQEAREALIEGRGPGPRR
jgi:tetratricopeptide (TPR) repeat protein